MIINTRAYGQIKVDDKQRIHFPYGIFGFEEYKYYVLVDSSEGLPFYWLQSEKTVDIAFLIVNPRLFINDYKLEIPQEDKKTINIETDLDILDFITITIVDDISNITGNLQGPIIINKKNHKAIQSISLNSQYSTKYYLMGKNQTPDSNIFAARGKENVSTV